ncbi:MAG: hypothetical protein R3C60_01785 [Parvularculaceae bacterium]
MNSITEITQPGKGLILAILLAGVAGGAVDAAYFSTSAILKGNSPVQVLQSIASFWIGRTAKDGGAAIAILGAATHFGLATIMAAGYAGVSLTNTFFRTKPLAAGACYGVFLYCVMYYLVLPARWPNTYPRFDGFRSIMDIFAHIGVALAIALIITANTRSIAHREIG